MIKNTSKPDVFIGTGCKIDPTVVFGNNCCVGDNTIIRKNVVIGNNVTIGENCIIGETPSVFGLDPNDERFETKKLIIGNNVCIRAYVGIERGFFEDSKIGDGCIFLGFCAIGHDANIGMNCVFFPFSLLHGSTNLGDNVKVFSHSVIDNSAKVGKSSVVYTKSFVHKGANVEAGSVIIGEEGDSLKQYCQKRRFLKNNKTFLKRLEVLEDAINGRYCSRD